MLAVHPAVKEAVVFAVRDPRAGEIPQAMVVLRDASQATTLEAVLRTHCIEHLAWYKVPERFEIVDALLRTASGKILHRV